MKITSKTAMAMIAVSSILWSLAGLLIKLLPWHPMLISGSRSLIAAIVFVVYMRLRGIKIKLNRPIVFSGLLLSLTMFLFVTANKLTTSANAIILQSTAPIFIVIISWVFFKQKYARKEYITIFFTLLGMVLFFFDELSPGNLLGNILAILSGVAFASMYVFTNRLPDTDSSLSSLLLGHAISAAVGIPYAFFFKPEITGQTMGVLLLLGVFQLGIPYILYGLAIRHCKPLYGSLLGMLETLMNPVWVFLMIGELPGTYAIIGGSVLIITIGVWCTVNALQESRGGM